MSKIAIISDIHSNLNAFNAVKKDILEQGINNLIVLGDIIDYGPRHHSVICSLKLLIDKMEFVVMIKGNHEYALFNDELDRFSSNRGRESLKLTKELLTDDDLKWLETLNPSGINLRLNGLNTLLIHGDKADYYWGKLNDDNLDGYENYDLVLSGHTHKPHFIQHNGTIFINPGSVGQPRNHNTRAQYFVFDTISKDGWYRHCTYNIEDEITYFDERQHPYYKTRLLEGI